ncbi:glycosyltransferase family 2 protein [Paracoccus sp. JM45]|uniref:glycosyltransferase family 2 protein n=1 Tax=Paracoccus sp. JM45 TaxID=2283626 RepID=UPI000E6CA2BE|nr:glycosyltransferase family 2 protein [Paracoccus sp. JM45]RJE78528.1 glycosyltransferase family 2 protein [Paracoccus sp. JM45]
MNTDVRLTVSVIITAHDAAATIADAVSTALAETETVEVIVVDDASRDRTIEAATLAGQGDSRLTVMSCAINGGPAAARNRALEIATGDFVAVLDADDFVLPGRFARLLSIPDADMIADNIVFVAEDSSPTDLPEVPTVDAAIIDLDLAAFVRANHSVRGSSRREWGFLKPIMRRKFLQRNKLYYDSTLRLGEDYDLYVRMLQLNARFKILTQVGYAARWRMNSLSSRHSTADLHALHTAARAHLKMQQLNGNAHAALSIHAKELHRRFLLRDFLDRRARLGRARAILSCCQYPMTLMPITRGILLDKFGFNKSASVSRVGRLLIE